MTRKRNFKTWCLLTLRRVGMLCKTPVEPTPRIRVTKTVHPDGTVEVLPARVQSKDIVNATPMKSEVHVWIENKKSALKNCQFDSETSTCICGIDLDDFAASGCSKSKRKTK
jgi:hypothetical protein